MPLPRVAPAVSVSEILDTATRTSDTAGKPEPMNNHSFHPFSSPVASEKPRISSSIPRPGLAASTEK